MQPSRDLVGSLGEERFLRLKAAVAERGLPFQVCAVPLPEDVRVTRRGFNLYVCTEHLKRAVQRLAQPGCRNLAWSNGRARVLPVEGEQAILQEQALRGAGYSGGICLPEDANAAGLAFCRGLWG